jgi:hypothetical protein
MCDAIRTVAVTEGKSMTERQLSAYGIGVQIHPRTVADLNVFIVSDLETETTDRNDIFHGTLHS